LAKAQISGTTAQSAPSVDRTHRLRPPGEFDTQWSDYDLKDGSSGFFQASTPEALDTAELDTCEPFTSRLIY
jgi:hypothetical protein